MHATDTPRASAAAPPSTPAPMEPPTALAVDAPSSQPSNEPAYVTIELAPTIPPRRNPTATAADPPPIATPTLGEIAPNDPFYDKMRLFLATASFVPQIVAVGVLTPNRWTVDLPQTNCNRELIWIVIQAAFLTVCLVNYWLWFWLVYWAETWSNLPARYRAHGVTFVTKMDIALYAFGLAWFMVGNALLLVIDSDTKACHGDDAAHGAHIHDLGLTLLAMAYARILWPCTLVLLGLPFLLICRPCVLRYVGDPTRDVHLGDSAYNGYARGASKARIDANSTRIKFSKNTAATGGEQSVCCCICLLEYETGDALRVLPCLHEFHVECVDQWLHRNASCPTCRKGIVTSTQLAVREVEAIV